MTPEYHVDNLVMPGMSVLAVEFCGGGEQDGLRMGLPLGTVEWKFPIWATIPGLHGVSYTIPGQTVHAASPVKIARAFGVYRYGGEHALVLQNNSSEPIKLSALWAHFEPHAAPTDFHWVGET